MMVERAACANSGLGDDFFGAGAVIPLLDKQSPCSIHERGAGGLGLRGTSRLRVEPFLTPWHRHSLLHTACRSHTVACHIQPVCEGFQLSLPACRGGSLCLILSMLSASSAR